jgi:tetratricopeptide (TPR) repeat protein
LTEKNWPSRLESSYLTADQKQQVRETAYVTLVSLADFYVRWSWVPGHDARGFVQSLDLLQRAQAFHEPTRAFFFVRAQCRRAQGDTAAAAEDEKQFKAAAARTAWDYYLPGHTAGWDGDLDEAIRSYQAALRLQPNHYNSLLFLAMRFNTDKINRRPEAIQLFTACLALRPDRVGPRNQRGLCYLHLRQWDDAITEYRELIRLHPHLSEAHSMLGWALTEKGRQDEAMAEMQEAVRLGPDVAMNQNNLAALLVTCPDPKLRDPARAVEHARRAVELESKANSPWDTLGVAYYRAGDWKASVAALEKSMELRNGGDDCAWFYLAMAHWKLGHNDEARAWYDRSIAWMDKNQPNDDELKRWRAEAEALMGLTDLPEDIFARP